MNNKIALLTFAAILAAPATGLYAAAGDSTIQGANGTATGTTPATTKPAKKHGGHHHHKKPAAAVETPATAK